MRMHLEMDDALVAEVDSLAGPRGRSAFVRDAVQEAVDRRRRAYRIRQSAGVVRDGGARVGRGPRRVGAAPAVR